MVGLVRVTGSHHHFKHPTKSGLVTIPHPKKDLQIKTVNSIFKQCSAHPDRRIFSLEGNQTMLYPIAILPGDDGHAWGVEVPDIPGCFSAGDDLDDAMAMAREAIEGHLQLLAEEGGAIPIANKVTVHAANPDFAGCIWALVDIDVTQYMGRAEKLNITLPGYLLKRIDDYVKSHPDQKSRSGFLASAALKVLQGA
jgi:predicted RNase H-like HicB family nuclease